MSNSTITNRYWPTGLPTLDENRTKQLIEKLTPVLESILQEENIHHDDIFFSALRDIYIPFCSWLVNKKNDKPLVIGINGSQGSGKSTLTKILHQILVRGFDIRAVSLSIDDLYKSKQQRNHLAQSTHHLLATRGVPGTHDVDMAISILNHLIKKDPTEITIPVFDKSTDDIASQSRWTKLSGVYDMILFEGWCVGTPPQDTEGLLAPVNELEKHEDAAGIWRMYVNQQLETRYKDLFSRIDIQLFLKVPCFEKVTEWRQLQEEKLKAATSTAADNKTMNHSGINRFIMHYERLTRHSLDKMPELSDVVFEIGEDHQIQDIEIRVNE